MENSDSGNYKTRVHKNLKQLAFWAFAWVATMALATFGPEFLWNSKIITVSAIIINLIAGVLMIFANIRHWKNLDEMMQKVQINAMGLALGVGIVGGLGYALLDSTNIITRDAEISVQVMLMALTYLAATFTGVRKYR